MKLCCGYSFNNHFHVFCILLLPNSIHIFHVFSILWRSHVPVTLYSTKNEKFQKVFLLSFLLSHRLWNFYSEWPFISADLTSAANCQTFRCIFRASFSHLRRFHFHLPFSRIEKIHKIRRRITCEQHKERVCLKWQLLLLDAHFLYIFFRCYIMHSQKNRTSTYRFSCIQRDCESRKKHWQKNVVCAHCTMYMRWSIAFGAF